MTAISTNCPPCEVEYEPNEDINYRSQRLADIAGFYHAFGLEISNRAGERLDHIATQAEFLYVLLAKEVALAQEGNQVGAEICRKARQTFFEEHVGWWLPTFSRLLFRVTDSNFYRELARFAASLSAAERVCLGVPPFRGRCVPKPAAAEAMTGCGDCRGA